MIVTVRYKGEDVPVIIDDQDADLFHAHRWYIMVQKRPSGKHKRYLFRTPRRGVTIYFHREALGITDRRIDVDHIDNDGLNNARSNVRVCAHVNNLHNRGGNHGAKSKFKGVSWYASQEQWVVRYTWNGKRVYVGAFRDEVEAARAYDEAVRPLHGEFFRPNLPEEA